MNARDGHGIDQQRAGAPDSTAVRTALWRALHVEVDAPPPVLDDTLGLRLLAPDDAWRERPDMDPAGTSGFRAAIVASWWDGLCAAGFEPDLPAVVASTGVSMYLTKATTAITLRRLAALAPGSTVAMSFLLPADLLADADRAGLEMSTRGARASGTPFLSFYTPDELVRTAREAGLVHVRHVPSEHLAERYFAGRPDGLRPSSAEDLVVAST